MTTEQRDKRLEELQSDLSMLERELLTAESEEDLEYATYVEYEIEWKLAEIGEVKNTVPVEEK